MLVPRHFHLGTVVTVATMSKEDGASKRLTKSIAFQKLRKQRSLPAPIAKPTNLPEFSVARADARAHSALEIDSYNWWAKPILDAFAAFQLDHNDLYDWRLLLFYFADAHFGKRTPGGRPRTWSDERLYQLLADFALIKDAHPGKPDTDLCKKLLKSDEHGKFGKRRYADMTPETMRRRLQDARKPLWCVCETKAEGRKMVARYLAEHPHYSDHTIHIIATGVPRNAPATVRPLRPQKRLRLGGK
jgi:hypothetical protein